MSLLARVQYCFSHPAMAHQSLPSSALSTAVDVPLVATCVQSGMVRAPSHSLTPATSRASPW